MLQAHHSKDIIPKYLNEEFFKRTLEHGLRVSNLVVKDIRIENLSLGGENYCSNIYRAVIQYKIQNGQLEKETKGEHSISVIVKSMPKEKQGVLGKLNIYTKETVFYLDIKPKMETLMWLLRESEKLAANYLYSTTEPEETIIFSDLCAEGYELKCRQTGLDFMHSNLVMKKLGQYHALSMVIAEKDTEIIKQYPFGLLNSDSIKSEAFKMLFSAQLKKLVALADDCREFDLIAKKLRKYLENFTECALQSVLPLPGLVNVLNHGDLWVNNLFFRYENNNSLKEVRFIDFQLCFYGSPGFDINYFFNTSVQLNVFKEHRNTLIETYYSSLLSTLLQLPTEQPPPTYEVINKEIRDREPYGFFVAFAFLPLMSMNTVDSKDNSLEKLQQSEFAQKKIDLMFNSNPRTMDVLKYTLKRTNDLGILDDVISVKGGTADEHQ